MKRQIAWDRKSPLFLSDIVGKTPVSIECGEDNIIFVLSDGMAVKFYHEQDCCEVVSIEDVNGDWADLIGAPLLVADERSEHGECGESSTWTFYTFRSVKGSVDVRWYGQSNGYYSERVDIVFGKLT